MAVPNDQPRYQHPAKLSTLDGSSGTTFTAFSPRDNSIGTSVTPLGNIRGDGRSTIAFAAPDATVLLGQEGSCFIVFGQTKDWNPLSDFADLGNGIDGVRLNGESQYDRFCLAIVGGFNYDKDDYDDFAISARGGSDQGVVYIVRGRKVWGGPVLKISDAIRNLNGRQLTGLFPGQALGKTLASLPRIDGTGFGALGIGTASPLSYLLLGQQNWNNTLNLAMPDGNHVVQINGTKSFFSYRVGNAGFFNGSPYSGIFFACRSTPTVAHVPGRAVWPASLALGTDPSVTTFDASAVPGMPSNIGFSSVGTLGNFNGDSYDDAIFGHSLAAPDGRTIAGMTFIPLGQLKWNATVDLSKVRQQVNIQILQVNGIAPGDQSGVFVGSAGKFFETGLDGALIGAFGASPQGNQGAGSSFILRGQRTFTEAVQELSKLDGAIGFRMDGVGTYDGCGNSVASAFNFTGNGLSTLVLGAPAADPSGFTTGAGYIIFPDTLTFTRISLSFNQGETLSLNSSMLAAVASLPKDNPKIAFFVSAVSRGIFSSTQFLQAQIPQGVYVTPDGTPFPLEFQVTARLKWITVGPQRATVYFNAAPQVIINHFVLNQIPKLQLLTPQMLSIYDPDNLPRELKVAVKFQQYIEFQRGTLSNTTAVTAFTPEEIQNEHIWMKLLSAAGTSNFPSFQFSVSDGKITLPFQTALVDFKFSPYFTRCEIPFNQGKTQALDETMVAAADPDTDASGLILKIRVVKYGSLNPPSKTFNITILQGNEGSGIRTVSIVPDSPTSPAPLVEVAADDGTIETEFRNCPVKFNTPPVVIQREITYTPGVPKLLTSRDLGAIDDHTPAGELLMSPQTRDCHLENLGFSGTPLILSPQQVIFNQQARFIIDGPNPEMNISFNDGALTTEPVSVRITPQPLALESTTNLEGLAIGAGITGGIGLFFLGIRQWIKYRVQKELDAAFEPEKNDLAKQLAEYQKNFIRPILDELFKEMDTTNCCGNRGEQETHIYKEEIENLITELRKSTELKQAGIDLDNYKEVNIEHLAKTIAKQIRLKVTGNKKECTFLCFSRKPKLRVGQIEESLEEIAEAVVTQLTSQGKGSQIELQDMKLIIESSGQKDPSEETQQPESPAPDQPSLLSQHHQQMALLDQRLGKLEKMVRKRNRRVNA